MGFKIRLGGTSEFLSKIDRKRDECKFVKGWDNLDAILFETFKEAKAALREFSQINGFQRSRPYADGIERFVSVT